MRKFLVAVDESELAHTVIAEAVALAQRIDARIVLFRAVGLAPELPQNLLVVSPEQLPGTLLELAKKQLEVHAAAIPPSLLAGVRVDIGAPWDAICTIAQTENVDLIVIGSHGHRVLDTLLGTTATRVVNHADRSVFVVRPRPVPTST